jgi:hypothetical protein
VAPQYQDDRDIPDETILWRRVAPGQVVVDDDGRVRPTSVVFQDHENGTPMSVAIAAETTLERVLAGHPGFGVVALTAGEVRAQGQGVSRAPLDDEPAHAEVFGIKPKKVSRHLARISRWVVHLSPPDTPAR